MNAWIESLGDWVREFLVLATIALAGAGLLRVAIRSPQLRVSLAWGTWLGLLALAALVALPGRPRVNLAWPEISQDKAIVAATPLTADFVSETEHVPEAAPAECAAAAPHFDLRGAAPGLAIC